MRALLSASEHTVSVQEIPTPRPEPGEILVRVLAAGLNPTDWKSASFLAEPGVIVGCEFAGEVVQVAEGVKDVKTGDRVAGFVHGAQYKDRGAFAEYVKADAELVWHIPEGTSYEEAATVTVGFCTAVQGLFHPNNLGLVGYPSTVSAQPTPWVLVFSGATTVGIFAVQLLHLAGYRVVATASPANFDLLTSLGADAVFDYNDPDVSQKIKEATGGTLALALDAYGTAETQEKTVRAFGSGPGKLVTTFLVDPSVQALRDDVEMKGTMLYTALGKAFTMPTGWALPAIPEDREQMVGWMPKITELLANGKVKPCQIKLWPGGLDAVKDGFEYMKSGKVSAEKIVFQI
ncbi:alcohol dehydrogenase [Punctularia strigosozonata HHB-11173 SS5]|uniref:alcohol dehydrogenase n=1 Tax=Punctularia strigosozonata (strain HHB-11173) TaxID=741275 RepID=UPI0004416681|nr:alcohol dehydrogenase [Punctularia strigosozonata HHB-11173 SS5]EIN05801.1 alcohol dehydrogenase [Punctularia strigosozonata HHB-11173 SS5]